jgi:hypothetical protein
VPKFVAPSDAAAQWTGALRNAAFFAYADNYLIDIKFGIIMDVEASRAVLLRQATDLEAPGQVQRFGSDVPNSGPKLIVVHCSFSRCAFSRFKTPLRSGFARAAVEPDKPKWPLG